MQPQFITLSARAKDITSQRFGRLVALGPIGHNRKKSVVWICQCDCGNTIVAATSNLISGNTRSCGCFQRDRASIANRTHGKARDSLYKTWTGIIQRCTNPNDPKYINYGGRGIDICDEWRSSFESFLGYVAELPNYKLPDYSIDRINNNGNYEPGNVRWATDVEQQCNRRDNHLLVFNGKTQSISAWARELDIDSGFILYRLRKGWPIEKIFLSASES